MTVQLAGVILARDEADFIGECIASLAWTDEVVVFEWGSTDATVRIAQDAGATVIEHRFENFAQQRNAALEQVDAEWILFVDADERIPPELASEIRTCLEAPTQPGYYIPRHNYIFGKLTRHAGWYPDYQLRLLKREAVHYDPERRVHERVVLPDGAEAGYLNTPMIHFNYQNVREFVRKQRHYAGFDAEIWYREGRRPKLRNFILQPWRQFAWRFWTLKGYKDGLHGLGLSLLMAWNEFDKYWQLRRLWRQDSAADLS